MTTPYQSLLAHAAELDAALTAARAERDAALDLVKSGKNVAQARAERDALAAQLATVTRERDEARAAWMVVHDEYASRTPAPTEVAALKTVSRETIGKAWNDCRERGQDGEPIVGSRPSWERLCGRDKMFFDNFVHMALTLAACRATPAPSHAAVEALPACPVEPIVLACWRDGHTSRASDEYENIDTMRLRETVAWLARRVST